MVGRMIGRWIIISFVAVFFISTLFGAVLGQPIGLTYVETESMSPTLAPGDGFISVPTPLAGPIEENDVIVFDAVELHGGGLVTHRVVGVTESGFITRGDANVVTDQDGGEPPVQETQIKAKALKVGGGLVVIPRVGLVVITIQDGLSGIQQFLAIALGTRSLLGAQGMIILIGGFSVLVYVLSGLVERERRPERQTNRNRVALSGPVVVIGLTALLVIAITLSMLIPAGVQHFQFVSSETSSDSPGVIKQGTTKNVTYTVPSHGALPVVAILQPTSEGIVVSDTHLYVAGGTTANVTVTLSAPPETGVYTETLVEYRYIAILPTNWLFQLHKFHPWAPIIAIDGVFAGLVMSLAFLLVGTDPIRLSRRREPLPLRVRIRRWLR